MYVHPFVLQAVKITPGFQIHISTTDVAQRFSLDDDDDRDDAEADQGSKLRGKSNSHTFSRMYTCMQELTRVVYP